MSIPVLASLEARCWTEQGVLLGRQRAAALDGLADRVDLTVVARATSREEGGQRVIRHPHSTLLIDGPRALARVLMEAQRARVIVIYLPGYVALLTGLLALLTGKKLVCIVVGDPEYALAADVVPGPKGVLARAILTRAMRVLLLRADVVRYVTQNYLQSRYPAPKSQTFASSDARPVDAVGERGSRQASRSLTVITVGSLDRPYKGIPDLIRALVAAGRPGTDVELRVAGSGKLANEQLDGLGLPPWLSVHPCGQLSQEELALEYGRAHLFALASWTEGLPRTLVEAMWAGLPCVATRVGGVGELLPPHALAEPRNEDSLARVLVPFLNQPDLRAEEGSRNRTMVEGYLAKAARSEKEFVDAVALLATPKDRMTRKGSTR